MIVAFCICGRTPIFAYMMPTYVSNYKLRMWDDSLMSILRERIRWNIGSTM